MFIKQGFYDFYSGNVIIKDSFEIVKETDKFKNGIFVELKPNLVGLAEYKEGFSYGQKVKVYIKKIIRIAETILNMWKESAPKMVETYGEELNAIIEQFANLNKDNQRYIDDLNMDVTNLKISVSSFDESEASIDEIVERIEQPFSFFMRVFVRESHPRTTKH